MVEKKSQNCTLSNDCAIMTMTSGINRNTRAPRFATDTSDSKPFHLTSEGQVLDYRMQEMPKTRTPQSINTFYLYFRRGFFPVHWRPFPWNSGLPCGDSALQCCSEESYLSPWAAWLHYKPCCHWMCPSSFFCYPLCLESGNHTEIVSALILL